MKTLLDDVNELEILIDTLIKMESQLRSGQIIGAHRECCRLRGILQEHKRKIIASAEKNHEK